MAAPLEWPAWLWISFLWPLPLAWLFARGPLHGLGQILATDAQASAQIPVFDVASRYTELGEALKKHIPATTAAM